MSNFASNKKAHFNYEIIETFEAGVVLLGAEVKSIRAKNVSLANSYAIIKDGEVWLINCHIKEFEQARHKAPSTTRSRKLLLKKRELNKLIGKINQDGLTLIPTKLYFLKGKVKVEIAVAKGKKMHDKRQTKKTRDWNRDKARYVRKSS